MTILSNSSRSARWLFLLFCTAPAVLGFSSWFGGASKENAAQSDLVSPIVNRELEASVVAHDWPFLVDNVYCEAWAYHALKDWDYMDRFVDLMSQEPGSKDVKQASDLVAKATVHNPSLLQYSLSLRAHSPLCEMHRTLARQVVLSHPRLVSQDAFCVSSRDKVASTPVELASLLGDDKTVDADDEELLPDEHVRGEVGSLIVFYANMGSAAFLDLYKILVKSNQRFVLRHRGHVSYEEIGGEVTILQGYGVRLDIRNVEYRVFDDTSDGNVNETSLLNLSTLHGLTNHTLAGIQVSALKNMQESDAENLQKELWRLHEAQQIHSQLVPPKWQRRQISLQAAIAISQSADVLYTLQDISQNLPSVASTLVHVGVTEEMQALSDLMEPIIRRTKGVTLTINGRIIPVGRPSFNVFELLQILQEEQQALDDMQRKLSPYLSIAGLRQVQRAWTMGKDSFLSSPESETNSASMEGTALSGNVRRIDVGRGWKDAIIYVNDLEKDPIYREWPRSLKQAMMSMQFGAPPSVRRNLFTMLCVIDPLEEGAGEHPGYSLGNQLMEAQFPARMGYLIVNSKDLNECRTWIENNNVSDDSIPCPTKPILTKDQSNMQALSRVDASTHAVHRLVTTIATEYAGNGLAIAFMEYVVQYLGQLMDDGGVLKMSDLVTVFGQLMEGLVGKKMSDAIQMAIEALLEDADERDRVSCYGKSLRFAISKAVSPGMGFVNGRPLPQGDPASAGQVFAEEQKHVFGLVMKGEITDTAPKSVYAKLLSGEGVFNRLHPLLSVSEKDLHIDLDHDFSLSSLLFPKSHSVDDVPEAVFIAEAAFDLETTEGIAFASGFLKVMDAYPTTIQIGEHSLPISIGYRVVPLPNSRGAPVCSILAYAAMVGAEGISILLSQHELLRKPIRNC
ncbi:UDP-glucose:Glycoprotein Glucosyltransferase [Fragilaria crotonensis]|nr:UDP-glucose:Glycoprotein Glucosyltransferase [Fragilaria crotonensis]